MLLLKRSSLTVVFNNGQYQEKAGTVYNMCKICFTIKTNYLNRISDVVRNVRSSNIFDDDFDPSTIVTSPQPGAPPTTSTMSKSCTASSIVELSKEREMEQKRRSLPPSKADSLDEGSSRPMRVS